MGQVAVVELKVREDASFLIGATGSDEGAFVGGTVDETALLTSQWFP